LVTSTQSSTPYHWLTPGYYKDKVKTSAVHHIPFTSNRHICDLPQYAMKLISAPPGGASAPDQETLSQVETLLGGSSLVGSSPVPTVRVAFIQVTLSIYHGLHP